MLKKLEPWKGGKEDNRERQKVRKRKSAKRAEMEMFKGEET